MVLYSSIVFSIVLIFRVRAFDQPPRITTPFQDSYYIPEDNDVPKVFQCSASGNPPPKYEWKLNGVTVRNSQIVTVEEDSGKLRILKSEIADFGTYQCFARNRVGTAMSVAFKLERTFIGQFSDTVQKTLPAIEEYLNVSIKCSGKPKCVPASDCKVEWKQGDGVKDSVQESNRIAIDKQGTLHFLYVTIADESTASSPYSCVLGNEGTRAYYKGANVIMPVTKVEPKNARPLLLFKADSRGFLGGEAELQCIFSGYKIPDMEWKLPDGTPIVETQGKYEFRDKFIKRTLKIKNLVIEDEGEYTCGASNQQAFGQAKVFLNVTSKPYFTKGQILESQVIPAGQDAQFNCKMHSVRGERPPTAPEWFRNGEPLPESQIGPDPSQKYELSADKSVLTIKNVQKPGDSCAIMCKAGNVIYDSNGDDLYSERYADATLRIIDPITVNVLSNMKTELTSTEPFSMAFNATKDNSIPQLFYKWKFIRPTNKTVYEGTKLEDLPFVIFNDDKTNLTIYPENAKEEGDENKVGAVVGLYQVEVYHDYDIVTKTFDIYTNLVIATAVPIVTSAGFDMWIIGVILGVIVLIIVIVFIICTLYRNRGGEYPVDKKEVAAGHDPEKELKDSGFHDLSRADGEKPPYDRVSLTDDVKPLESDEDSILGDYDDDAEMSKFNEEGSFIGVYMDKKGLLHG